jgi:cell division protein FtsN
MSDAGYREIQLSGKHVIFLFMAGVVAAVAIFLLGVSVGRGVTKPDTGAPPPIPAETEAAQTTPPPSTAPAPGELQFPGALQGKTDPKATPEPPPASTAKPSSTPTPSPKASASPQASAKGDVWFVVVGTFSSRDNAERQIATLKDKDIAAKLNIRTGAGAKYQVRVGPLPSAAADDMVARLRKEGLKPSKTR